MTYEVKNPNVLGIGLAAMRDVASSSATTAPTRARRIPSPARVRHTIAQGISQSGNALKTFLYLGFNQDEAGRIVFDGANPHIAGRQTAINIRFGVPSGSGTLYEPGGEGVLWWTRTPDAARDRARGRPARPLPRHAHLPEDLRDLRRHRIQRPADDRSR